jgi:hypothetical protein
MNFHLVQVDQPFPRKMCVCEIIHAFWWYGKIRPDPGTMSKTVFARQDKELSKSIKIHIAKRLVAKADRRDKKSSIEDTCKDKGIFKGNALIVKPAMRQVC